MQPWHGGKIVVLARNHPLQSCSLCGRPAQWRLIPADDDFVGPEDDFDDDIFGWVDDEFLYWDWDDDEDTNTYCDECAPMDATFTVLPNSPREGADCFDNVWSWRTWPLDEE